ncbi:MAG: DNA polymerase III subunit delta [Holophagales bacterium]|jgi:DNA polymerase III delta subunit|nr:DNA polymerase III subunit delta [Holophagales bacterium]
MDISERFLDAGYALLHGDDTEGRMQAVSAWKARHVDPDLEDFSLTTCQEGCHWAAVQGALMELAPFGANRVVVVPQADNLLERAKELPPAVKSLLTNPMEGTYLLLVARGVISAAPGKILSTKPFSDWNKEGRVFKVGALDNKAAIAFLESKAKEFRLILDTGVAQSLAERLGGSPGILTRALEVLELIAEDHQVTHEMLDQSTFRLGEQNAFSWSQAWQKGQIGEALKNLRIAIEDEPDGAPLMLLGQARREVERLCRLREAARQGVSASDLASILGLTPKQIFLLDGYKRVLDRIQAEGLKKLVTLLADTDSDIKGGVLSRSPTPLINLTVSLCRAWGGK